MFAKLNAAFLRILLLIACAATTFGIAVAVQRYPQLALLALGVVAWRRFRRGPSPSNWTHGSATVSDFAALGRGGLLSDKGIPLGKVFAEAPSRRQAIAGLLSPALDSRAAVSQFLAAFLGPHWLKDWMIRTFSIVHLACFAPAGAGKGVSVAMPVMLSYPDSLVCIDVKGELYVATAKHRQRCFRHRLISLAPLGINGKPVDSDRINPLDFIDDASDEFLDQVREMADLLVPRTGRETDEHWLDCAVLVLTAFIAFVCACEPNRLHRNLNTVRLLLSSRHAYEASLKAMQETTSCQGVIQRLGEQLSWFQDKELASVLTTVQRFTQFLDSPAIARHVETSSFDPAILKKGKATVFLILPHDKLTSLAPLNRMWISTIMRVTTRGEVSEKRPILWLLDEYAHIGKIRAVEDAVTLLRGMGVRLFFFFQSIGQMQECFGERAASILDNIATQLYFGLKSYASAEELSKRIGETTISTVSFNRSTSDSRPVGGTSPKGEQPGSHSVSTSFNRSDMARRILRPEEILTLDESTGLLLHRNLPVVPVRLIKYYRDKEFRRGWFGYGTGRQRGLGLAGGIAACAVLAASLAFANLCVRLPEREAVRRGLVSLAGRLPDGGPHGEGDYPAMPGEPASLRAMPAPPPPSWRTRRRSTRLPSRSGYLIPIR